MRICPGSRTVWLDDQVHLWHDTILQSWTDYLDQDETAEILIATPQPNRLDAQEAAHLIIVQHTDFPDEAACLVSLSDNQFRGGQMQRQAIVLPVHITHELLLTVSNRLSICLRWTDVISCTSWFGDFELTHEGMVGRPGLALHVEIVHITNDVEWQLQEGQHPFPIQPQVNAPGIIHVLYDVFQQRRNAFPGEPINLRITTWMLNHHDSQVCLFGRDVDLPLNPNLWLTEMLRHWPDVHYPHLPVDAFLVSPLPQPTLWMPGEILHVILHQQPRPESVSVLITSFDQTNAAANLHGLHRAVMVPRASHSEDILQAVALDDWCAHPTASRHCQVSQGIHILDDASTYGCEHGMGFRAILTQRPPEAWETRDAEEVHLIQTNVRLQSARRDENNTEARTSFKPVHECMEWLDNHFVLPCFDVEHFTHDEAQWMPQCLNWLRIPWFDYQTVCHEIWIYYDGSFFPEVGQIGYAAAAFALTPDGWTFAGAISGNAQGKVTGSYHAELRAATIAAKFLHDLLKVVCANQAFPPSCTLLFDSLTVGRQTEGVWKSQYDPNLGHLVRSLIRLCEARYQVLIQHKFVPGHTGDPGKEMVDVLAKDAALHQPLQDWTHFFDFALKQSFVDAVAWVWLTTHADWSHMFEGGELVLPGRPTTVPTAGSLSLP